MKTLAGYSDKISVLPGATLAFFVSSEDAAAYQARLVRVVHGDVNPAGPGYLEEEVKAGFAGQYAGRRQIIHAGSYAYAATAWSLAALSSFTLQVMAWPTTPHKGEQTLLAHWDGARGFQLLIDENGCAAIRVGDGRRTVSLSTGRKLLDRHWYCICASYDAESGELVVRQGGAIDTTAGVSATGRAAFKRAATDVPLTIAAYRAGVADGKAVFAGFYNGKLSSPRIFGTVLTEAASRSAVTTQGACARGDLLVGWNFARDMGTDTLRDISSAGLDLRTVNMPTRAMTDYNWTGEQMCWTVRPDQYGAVHFHDDDLYDAGWTKSFEWTVPPGTKSGVYCAHVSNDKDEDFIPFVVRAPRGAPTSKLLFLMPTATYMAYGNEHLTTDAPAGELLMTKVTVLQRHDMFLASHREYGGSLYDTHSDYSGVAYSSRLRPLLNMRPKVQSLLGGTGSAVWGLNADTHITHFLEASGEPFDVMTDEDLHYEGSGALEGYRCVVTGTHPEYYSKPMLDALERFKQQGGRLMYLGGNGFYWRVAYHPTAPGIIELRRAEAGIRSWTAATGEYYHSFTGEYGGLWQRNARPPQSVVGVGTTAQGFDCSTYYRRTPQSHDPRAAFIFAGVDEEVIGDFGLVGGGAAGLEIDRADAMFGTPRHALIVAASEGHSDAFLMVPEDIYVVTLDMGGKENPHVHADMVFFETPHGGAVFSVGSIAWAGSLSHRNFDNTVARITRNVIKRFLDEAPFPAIEE